MKLVLLVEDNELCAKYFRLILEDALGLKVHCVKDGLSALDFLRENKPDLIHMDIQLPKISGWETIDRIASRPDLDRIPICVVSASLLSRDVKVGQGHKRAATVRAKPIGAPIYAQMILELLFPEIDPESGQAAALLKAVPGASGQQIAR